MDGFPYKMADMKTDMRKTDPRSPFQSSPFLSKYNSISPFPARPLQSSLSGKQGPHPEAPRPHGCARCHGHGHGYGHGHGHGRHGLHCPTLLQEI